MAQVASDAGLSRESLYKALSGERNPTFDTFDTVLRVIDALGLKLRAEAALDASEAGRVGRSLNPPHLGELIRESMDDAGWNVTETAARLGCERGTLSRLLNGKAGVSANMALALEDTGWGTADHWMRDAVEP